MHVFRMHFDIYNILAANSTSTAEMRWGGGGGGGGQKGGRARKCRFAPKRVFGSLSARQCGRAGGHRPYTCVCVCVCVCVCARARACFRTRQRRRGVATTGAPAPCPPAGLPSFA